MCDIQESCESVASLPANKHPGSDAEIGHGASQDPETDAQNCLLLLLEIGSNKGFSCSVAGHAHSLLPAKRIGHSHVSGLKSCLASGSIFCHSLLMLRSH